MDGGVWLRPVAGLPEVRPGDDLADLLAANADIADGDVVVVAQKIVSKAEGRLAPLEPGEEPQAARRRLAREEAARVVADTPWVLITETAHGFVCANGGVDASNAPGGSLVLLPADPDASARRLRAGLLAATGNRVGVVVADSFGRPWRLGQTDVAIGVAGLEPIRDERGGVDRQGRLLEVTQAAVADALAGAADLVRRKADGVPAVVVRGSGLVIDADGPGAAALVRPASEDLFRRGAGGLAGDLARAGVPPSGPVEPWIVDRALAAAAGAGATVTRLDGTPLRLAFAGEPVQAGVAAGLTVAALVDAGATARHRPPSPGEPGQVIVEAGRTATIDGRR